MPVALSWVGVAPPPGHLWHISAADRDGRVLLCHRDPARARAGAAVRIGRFAAVAEARIVAQLLDAAVLGRSLQAPAAPWRLATGMGELKLCEDAAAVRLVFEIGRPGSGCLEVARLFRIQPVSPAQAGEAPRACVLWRLAQLRCSRRDISPLEPLGSGDAAVQAW